MNSKDIARLAGVSRSTVSRVVNNYPNVPVETREKVEKVIKEYGYVPHASARSLAGKQNKVLGIFVTNSVGSSQNFRIFQNTYFTPFMTAAIDFADELGYNVLVSMINKSEDFKKIRALFYNKTLSGGIFIGAYNNSPEIFDFIENGYKLVVIDQEYGSTGGERIIINSNNFDGAYTATKHLIEYSHSKIAHICGDLAKFSGIKRLEGYKKAMNEAGLPIKEQYVVEGDFTEESGIKCTQLLLQNSDVTAIFASNDAMAVGAIKAVKEAGREVPGDVSIVGYDDAAIAGYISPTLTTIRSSILDMSSIAVKSLINFIEKGSSAQGYYTIPTELIVRESTGNLAPGSITVS